MSDLSPEGRALLEGVRDDLDASPEDRDRVGRALAARLGLAGGTIAGGTLVGATSVSTASAATAGASTTLAAGVGGSAAAGVVATSKWIAVTLLVAAAGVGGGSIYLSSSPDAPARAAAPAVAAPPSPVRPLDAPRARSSTPAPTPDPPPAERVWPPTAPESPWPELAASGHSREAARQAQDRSPTSAPASVAVPEPFDGTVGAETRVLRRADEALRSGNPSLALSLLDEHARSFPQGVLSEERSAERVTTLCALGRTDEARAEARRFLATTPDSPLANEIRGSCGADNRQDPSRVP
jgi:hypothetical protein